MKAFLVTVLVLISGLAFADSASERQAKQDQALQEKLQRAEERANAGIQHQAELDINRATAQQPPKESKETQDLRMKLVQYEVEWRQKQGDEQYKKQLRDRLKNLEWQRADCAEREKFALDAEIDVIRKLLAPPVTKVSRAGK